MDLLAAISPRERSCTVLRMGLTHSPVVTPLSHFDCPQLGRLAMTLLGCAQWGSPHSDHQGSQQEARFIDKS